MKVFITGINGFIGSNLAGFLIDNGLEVSGSVRETSDLSFLKDISVTLHQGDILNLNFLTECFQGHEIVFHVAALASDWGSQEDFFRINYIGTQTVAQAAKRANVRRLVFLSSASVYGFSGYRYADETHLQPEDNFYYGLSKRAAEIWLREFYQKTGLPITIIQPANVFGPKDRTFFIKFAPSLEHRLIPWINRGSAWTCPTYIENLTEALWLAATSDAAIGETFIISDGLDISWREFILKICNQLRVKPPQFSLNFNIAFRIASTLEIFYQFFKIKKSPPITKYRVCNFGIDYHFSIRKAQNLIGYRPRIDIDEAVRKTVEWYQNFKKEANHADSTRHQPISP